MQMVSDATMERSTGTLRVRVGCLRRLGLALNKNPLDCDERDLYAEFCRLRERNSPPTKATGILQSCRFAAAITGSVHLNDLLTSKRCIGAAYGPQEGTTTKQRAALTLKQLIALENYIMSVDEPLERAICGQILFCVYSQSRWSDALHLRVAPRADVEAGGPGNNRGYGNGN